MFERAVEALLRRYFQDYLNIDDSTSLDNLVVSLWSGKVELYDLRLKTEALEPFFGDLFQVQHGSIGSVRVKIPWSSLQSQPIVVALDDVRLTVSSNGDSKKEDNTAWLENRRRELQALDVLHSTQQSFEEKTGDMQPEDVKKEQSFLEKLGTKILDNLQLELTRVHIRFREKAHGEIGLGLGSVVLRSVDENWHEAFVVGGNVLRKLARTKDIYAYFRADCKDNHNLFVAYDAETRTSLYPPLLLQTSTQLKLTLPRKASKKFQAKLTVEIELSAIACTLRRSQYSQLIALVSSSTNRLDVLQRPTTHDGPKVWFQYCVRKVMQRNAKIHREMKRQRWVNAIAHRYITLYKRTLEATSGWLPGLSPRELRILAKMEEDKRMTMKDVYHFRNVAHDEVRKQLNEPLAKVKKRRQEASRAPKEEIQSQDLEEKSSSSSSSWGISSWWYGSSASSSEISAKPESNAAKEIIPITEEERDQLLQTIGFEEEESSLKQSKDEFPIRIKVNAYISSANITLVHQLNGEKTTIGLFEVQNVYASAVLHENQAQSLKASANSFFVLDTTTLGTKFPHVVKPQASSGADKDILNVEIVTPAPEDKEENPVVYDIKISHPLQVVYNAKFIDRLGEFFAVESNQRAAIAEAATETWDSYKELYGDRSMEDYIESLHKVSNTKIVIQLAAPNLVVPESVLEQGRFLCFSLGTFYLAKAAYSSNWTLAAERINVLLEESTPVLENMEFKAVLSSTSSSNAILSLDFPRLKCRVSTSTLRNSFEIIRGAFVTEEFSTSTAETDPMRPLSTNEQSVLLRVSGGEEPRKRADVGESASRFACTLGVDDVMFSLYDDESGTTEKLLGIETSKLKSTLTTGPERTTITFVAPKLVLTGANQCTFLTQVSDHSMDEFVNIRAVISTSETDTHSDVVLALGKSRVCADFNSIGMLLHHGYAVFENGETEEANPKPPDASDLENIPLQVQKEAVFQYFKRTHDIEKSQIELERIVSTFGGDHKRLRWAINQLYGDLLDFKTAQTISLPRDEEFCHTQILVKAEGYDLTLRADGVDLGTLSLVNSTLKKQVLGRNGETTRVYLQLDDLTAATRNDAIFAFREMETSESATPRFELEYTSKVFSMVSTLKIDAVPFRCKYDQPWVNSLRMALSKHKILSGAKKNATNVQAESLSTPKRGTMPSIEINIKNDQGFVFELATEEQKQDIIVTLNGLHMVSTDQVRIQCIQAEERIQKIQLLRVENLGLKDSKLDIENVFAHITPDLRQAIMDQVQSLVPNTTDSASHDTISDRKGLKILVHNAKLCWTDIERANAFLDISEITFDSRDSKLGIDALRFYSDDDIFLDEPREFLSAQLAQSPLQIRIPSMDLLLNPISREALFVVFSDMTTAIQLIASPSNGDPPEQTVNGTRLVVTFEAMSLRLPTLSTDHSLYLSSEKYPVVISNNFDGTTVVDAISLSLRHHDNLVATLPVKTLIDLQDASPFIRVKLCGKFNHLTSSPECLISMTKVVSDNILGHGPSFLIPRDDSSSSNVPAFIFEAENELNVELVVSYQDDPDVARNLEQATVSGGILYFFGFHLTVSKVPPSPQLEQMEITKFDITMESASILQAENDQLVVLRAREGESVQVVVKRQENFDDIDVIIPWSLAHWKSSAIQRLFDFYLDWLTIQYDSQQHEDGKGLVSTAPSNYSFRCVANLHDLKVSFPSRNEKYVLQMLCKASLTYSSVMEQGETDMNRVFQTDMKETKLCLFNAGTGQVERVVLEPVDLVVVLQMADLLVGLPLERNLLLTIGNASGVWSLGDTGPILDVLLHTLRHRPSRRKIKHLRYQKVMDSEYQALLSSYGNDQDRYKGLSYKINVVVSSLKFTIASLYAHLPVIQFGMNQQSTFKGSSVDDDSAGIRIQELKFKGDLGLNDMFIRCFNHRNTSWEPILEPVDMGCEAEYNLNENKEEGVPGGSARGLSLVLQSHSTFRLNVHPVHITTLWKASKEASEIQSLVLRKTSATATSNANEDTDKEVEITVQNLTGMDVELFESDGVKKVIIKHGEKRPVSISFDMVQLARYNSNDSLDATSILSGDDDSFASTKDKEIAIPNLRLHLNGYQPLSTLPVMETPEPLIREIPETQAKIVWSVVRNQNNLLVGTLSTMTAVENATTTPLWLQIRALSDADDSKTQTFLSEPGSSMHVNVATAHCCGVSVKMEEDGEFQSIPLPMLVEGKGDARSQTDEEFNRTVRFSSTNDELERTLQINTKRSSHGLMVVRLLAPVTLCNVLTRKVSIDVKIGKNGVIRETRTCNPGASTMFFYSVPKNSVASANKGSENVGRWYNSDQTGPKNKENVLFIRFQVEGMHCGRWIDLFAMDTGKSESSAFEYKIRDASNRVQSLRFSKEWAATGCMQFLVWSPYWIVNKTGLTLIYGQTGEAETQVLPGGFVSRIDLAADQLVPVLEETFENQRKYPGTGWSSSMLMTDRPSWSDRDGLENQPRLKETVQLPDPWRWTWDSDWYVDKSGNVDENGWEYCTAFTTAIWSNKEGWGDFIRRRRWVRWRKPLVQDEDAQTELAYMFSPPAPEPDTLFVRIEGQTRWSKSLVLSGVATSHTFRLYEKDGGPFHEMVLTIENHIQAVQGALRRTNVCTISPRITIRNHLENCDLHVVQAGVKMDPITCKALNDCLMKWRKDSLPQNVHLKLGDSSWSGPFDIHRLGNFPLKILWPDDPAGFRHLRVEIKRGNFNSTISVDVYEEDPATPSYRVENFTSDVIRFRQRRYDNPSTSETVAIVASGGYPIDPYDVTLKTNEMAPFAWAFPIQSKDGVQQPMSVEVIISEMRRFEIDVNDLSTNLKIELPPTLRRESNIAPTESPALLFGQPVIISAATAETKDSIPSLSSNLFSQPPPLRTRSLFSGRDRSGTISKNEPWLAKVGPDQWNVIEICDAQGRVDQTPVREGNMVQLRCRAGDGSLRFLQRSDMSLEWAHEDEFRTELGHFIISGDVSLPFVLLCAKEPAFGVGLSKPEKNVSSLIVVPATEESEIALFRGTPVSASSLPKRFVFATVDLDGPTRVLRFSPSDNRDQVDKFESPSASFSSSSSSPVTSSQSLAEQLRLGIKLELEDVQVSLLGHRPEELSLIGASLTTSYRDTNLHRSIEVYLNSLRIDNQILGTPYPNLLRPTPKFDEKYDALPVCHFTLVSKHHLADFAYIHYLGVNLKELDLTVDEDLLTRITETVHELWMELNLDSSTGQQQKQDDPDAFSMVLPDSFNFENIEQEFQRFLERLENSSNRPSPGGTNFEHTKEEQLYYFEMLQLFTVKINLSYERSSSSIGHASALGETKVDPLSHFLNAINVGITNITKAPLVFRALALENPTIRLADLRNEIITHYRAEVKRNIFTVVGAVGLLGDANAVISTLGGAVHVFLNEPMQGIVKSPADFGKGVGKGTMGLLKGTVRGLAMAAGGVAGTVSKSVNYLNANASVSASSSSRPLSFADGVSVGGESLLRGFREGLQGVVDSPIQGASRGGGFGGFIRGVGKGVVGVVTKPVGGVFEFVSKTTEGAVASTKSDQERQADLDSRLRMRPARLFRTEKRVMFPYNDRDESTLRSLLTSLAGGDYDRRDPNQGFLDYMSFWPLPLLLVGTHLKVALCERERKRGLLSNSQRNVGLSKSASFIRPGSSRIVGTMQELVEWDKPKGKVLWEMNSLKPAFSVKLMKNMHRCQSHWIRFANRTMSTYKNEAKVYFKTLASVESHLHSSREKLLHILVDVDDEDSPEWVQTARKTKGFTPLNSSVAMKARPFVLMMRDGFSLSKSPLTNWIVLRKILDELSQLHVNQQALLMYLIAASGVVSDAPLLVFSLIHSCLNPRFSIEEIVSANPGAIGLIEDKRNDHVAIANDVDLLRRSLEMLFALSRGLV